MVIQPKGSADSFVLFYHIYAIKYLWKRVSEIVFILITVMIYLLKLIAIRKVVSDLMTILTRKSNKKVNK